MKDISERVMYLRKKMKFSQREFGDAIGLSNSGISNIENGIRKVTEQHIKLICNEFNVSEDWIRHGEGEIFSRPKTFSLDEYAKKNNLSELEASIIKDYIELDVDTREKLMTYFKVKFGSHSETASAVAAKEIDDEVESYRRELEAEKKGATLSASDVLKGKSV